MNLKKKATVLLGMLLLLSSTFAITVPRYATTALPTGGAELTRSIFDDGRDTDNDTKYDFLDIAVEINVSAFGYYRIEVAYLRDSYNYSHSIWAYNAQYLDTGAQLLNFSVYGPQIFAEEYNVIGLAEIRLYDNNNGTLLDYLPYASLTRVYNYTQFNMPMNDMQVELTVYPNATVVVGGSSNYSRIYPYPYYNQPTVNATLGFSTEGSLTSGSVNGTMRLPEYPWSWQQFPYNSTSLDFASEYRDGMLTAQLDTTVHLPPQGRSTYPFNLSDFSFSSTYSSGMLNVDFHGQTEIPPYPASQFPFNISDATVLADFAGNEIDGNITLHAIPGFLLGDVLVHFHGNRTKLSLTGYVNVIYGDYFGTTINETVLEDMLAEFNSTIPGREAGSLYDMSENTVECTRLNTSKTPIGGPWPGARVDYNATIEGNFTNLLATQLSHMLYGYGAPEETHQMVYACLDAALSSVDHGSLTAYYLTGSRIGFVDLTLSSNVKTLWGEALQLVPPTVPPEYGNQVEAWLKIANATADAIQNAFIDATYSSSLQELDFSAFLVANVTQLKNKIIPILPDTVPSQFRDLVESCTNTTYCRLDLFNSSFSYVNGMANFNASWILAGNFTAELNLLKRGYVAYLNLTSPYMIDWQMRVLNSTEVDISNLKAQVRQCREWRSFSFEQLKLHPSKDEIDFIRFRLGKLLNMTNGYYEPPREFERLTVVFNAGFNGTHTVLFYAPNTIPEPDATGNDYKSMVWQNVSLSRLKDLLFKVAYQRVVNYASRTFYVPIFTNSTISNFGFDAGAKCLRFNVTGVGGLGFFNITIPRALLYANPSQWVIIKDGVQLSSGAFNVTENADYVFIYLPYSHSTHEIKIQGMWIITEFPSSLLPLVLTVLSLLATAIAIKQRRKLGTLATKYQRTLRAFASRLHQPRT